ncbi:hypothetical protein [Sphingomonas sp.]|uniref:hypothetical protein n=1 Tax=Sphingomonas sp. TaxID=28214 RepID=UPI0031E44F99
MRGFEPLPRARFSIEVDDGVEWVVSRARRNWFALPFLAVWLTFWTFGGIAAIGALLTGSIGAGERVFMALWLAGWAAGWVFAASWLGWQINGRSQIGVRDGALEYRWRMPLLSRTRRYDGREVRRLRAGRASWPWNGGGFMQPNYPPFFPMTPGSVQFDYGGRTINVMPGLDEAEGDAIAAWVGKRLPAAGQAVN